VIQVTTSEEAPEGPPQDIEIEPMTSTKFKVRWGPPERSLWHGSVLGYYLGYKELSLALAYDTGIYASGDSNGKIGGSSSVGGGGGTAHFPGTHTTSSLGDMHGYHFKTVEVTAELAEIPFNLLESNVSWGTHFIRRSECKRS
jgi:hypothetical protein